MVVTGLGERIQVGRADPPPASDQLPGDDPEGPGRGARDESPLPLLNLGAQPPVWVKKRSKKKLKSKNKE